MKTLTIIFSLFAVLTSASLILGQDHHHDHRGHMEEKAVKPPTVFLDKSPRIVWYQLNRLENERLLLVERNTTDKKYEPVYLAILTRGGMSPQHREESLAALVTLNGSNAAAELLKALQIVEPDDRQQRRTAHELASMLLRQPQKRLRQMEDSLKTAADSDNPLLRSVAHAALIAAGNHGAAWTLAQGGNQAMLDWLGSVSLLPSASLRAGLRDRLVEVVQGAESVDVQRAAIRALALAPNQQDETFRLVAPYVDDGKLRPAAVDALLAIDSQDRDVAVSEKLAEKFVTLAESTAPAGRTTDEFIDIMQLADQLLARIDVQAAREFRRRLREVTVRMVRIRTVEEEMRYDTPYFAVEAGRPVQVILENEDLMPHNLAVTTPGALKEVAQLGLMVGPEGGLEGKAYVPHSKKVLHATHMVQPGKLERLTFTAPTEPGEYPYVCTFPRHWMRMYGVMVVVNDLDAWLKNPVPPKDPVGSDRAFVQAWTIDDFRGEIAAGLRGRSIEIGERLFAEATCALCHKVKGKGGAVGPELTEVFKRYKGEPEAVLHEILDPSHRIDPKYAVHVVVTLDGKVVTGIVTAQDSDSISILDNPESPKPTVISKSEIEEIVKTSKSMMPKALLDRFTRDEIFEILAYLREVGPETQAAASSQ